jgi:hypothetical protein
MIKRLCFIVFSLALLYGCATPVTYTDKEMKRFDDHSKYAIEEKQGGFFLNIVYSRYQFIPESDALLVACKQTLTNIAWEIAEEDGKKIKPINEQRIQISAGRNGFTGITSCSARVPVDFEN